MRGSLVVVASALLVSGCTGDLTGTETDAAHGSPDASRTDAGLEPRDGSVSIDEGGATVDAGPTPDPDAGPPPDPRPGCGTEAADIPPWGWQWPGMAAVHELAIGDYDGDCKDDAAIVQRDAGLWWHRPSGAGRSSRFWGWHWAGMGGHHEVVPGDFDGDGMDDPTIVDRANGSWWTTPSNGAPARFSGWRWEGMSGVHEVVPGDFDGDGLADPTIVLRPAGLWWTSSSGPTRAFWEWQWAGMGDAHEVVPGDFDGDGISDRTIVHRAAGTWWTLPSSGAASRFWGWTWAGMGAHHDVYPGDFDGDGLDDPAIVDRARGQMWITTSDGSPQSVWGNRIPHLGPDADLAPGDYDGDGRTDIAFVNRGSGRWFIRPSSRSCPAFRVPFDSPPSGTPWRFGGGDGYPDVVSPSDGCTTVVSTRAELEAALAAAQPGTTVYVADHVGIDLTGATVTIPAFVTLASGRGRGGSLGGLLYSDTANYGGMVRVGGEGVRITGLRIRGHQSEVCPNDDSICGPFSRGIQSSFGGLEIDNCVLTGWTYGAVAISSSFGTHIHHNFIHHNQREESGYGIVLESETLGSSALIEWNRFNFNRHAVAGGGAPGQSYTARYNFVGARAIGHVFDMHDGMPPEIAGTNIQIYGNAVLVLDRSIVRIRSRPTEGAWIFGNCFARGPFDGSLPWYSRDAIAQTGTLGNFWVDYHPDATHDPNRYDQTAASCGVGADVR